MGESLRGGGMRHKCMNTETLYDSRSTVSNRYYDSKSSVKSRQVEVIRPAVEVRPLGGYEHIKIMVSETVVQGGCDVMKML